MTDETAFTPDERPTTPTSLRAEMPATAAQETEAGKSTESVSPNKVTTQAYGEGGSRARTGTPALHIRLPEPEPELDDDFNQGQPALTPVSVPESEEGMQEAGKTTPTYCASEDEVGGVETSRKETPSCSSKSESDEDDEVVLDQAVSPVTDDDFNQGQPALTPVSVPVPVSVESMQEAFEIYTTNVNKQIKSEIKNKHNKANGMALVFLYVRTAFNAFSMSFGFVLSVFMGLTHNIWLALPAAMVTLLNLWRLYTYTPLNVLVKNKMTKEEKQIKKRDTKIKQMLEYANIVSPASKLREEMGNIVIAYGGWHSIYEEGVCKRDANKIPGKHSILTWLGNLFNINSLQKLIIEKYKDQNILLDYNLKNKFIDWTSNEVDIGVEVAKDLYLYRFKLREKLYEWCEKEAHIFECKDEKTGVSDKGLANTLKSQLNSADTGASQGPGIKHSQEIVAAQYAATIKRLQQLRKQDILTPAQALDILRFDQMQHDKIDSRYHLNLLELLVLGCCQIFGKLNAWGANVFNSMSGGMFALGACMHLFFPGHHMIEWLQVALIACFAYAGGKASDTFTNKVVVSRIKKWVQSRARNSVKGLRNPQLYPRLNRSHIQGSLLAYVMGAAAVVLAGKSAFFLIHGAATDQYPKSMVAIFQQPAWLHSLFMSLPISLNYWFAGCSMFLTSIYATVLYQDQCLRRYGSRKYNHTKFIDSLRPGIINNLLNIRDTGIDKKIAWEMLDNIIASSGAFVQSIMYFDYMYSFLFFMFPGTCALHPIVLKAGCSLFAGVLFFLWNSIYENTNKKFNLLKKDEQLSVGSNGRSELGSLRLAPPEHVPSVRKGKSGKHKPQDGLPETSFQPRAPQ